MKTFALLFISIFFGFSTVAYSQNTAPIVSLGGNITVDECDLISINPVIVNPDDNELEYFWDIPEGLVYVDSSQYSFKFVAPSVTSPTGYIFKLYVNDGFFISNTEEIEVTVVNNPTNQVPTASLFIQDSGSYECQHFILSLYNSTDPDADYVFYEWTYPTDFDQNGSSSYPDLHKTLPAIDTDTEYDITYVVKDCELSTSPVTITISSKNTTQVPPEVSIYNTANQYYGTKVAFQSDTVFLRYTYNDINCDEEDHVTWIAPVGINIDNSDPDRPFFIAPVVGVTTEYEILLIGNDGIDDSESDTIVIPVLSNEDEAKFHLSNCYNTLKERGMFGLNFQWYGYSFNPYFIMEQTDYNSFVVTNQDNWVVSTYSNLYLINNYACKVIEEIPNSSIDINLKTEFVAEAKFIRAIANFYLTTFFNNPPFVDTYREYNRNLIKVPYDVFYNSDSSIFYAHIEQDLLDAIDDLPLTRPAGEKYRATKGAAQALLGKSYLYQRDWQGAKNQLDSVIQSGLYSLVQPQGSSIEDYFSAYSCNFTYEDMIVGLNTYEAEHNSESVFEIDYSFDLSTLWNAYLPGWGSSGSLWNKYFGLINSSWKNSAPLNIYADIFELAPLAHPAGYTYDPRKNATLIFPGDTMEFRQEKVDSFYYGIAPEFSYFPKSYGEDLGLRKYYWPFWHEKSGTVYPNNWRVIRYADILLMYAEAEFQLNGNTPDALNAINEVRNRVGMDNITTVTPEAIMHERDVELGAEGLKFWDMVRWSELDIPWVQDIDFKDGFIPGTSEHLPIPDYMVYSGSAEPPVVLELIEINDKNIEENKLKAYPNPVLSTLTIESTFSMEEISIYNSIGQKVISTKANMAHSFLLDASAIKTGFFILSVTLEDGRMFNSVMIKD